MTYGEAKQHHLDTLETLGWEVQKTLKTPWAKRSDGVKMWFKAQSVYYGWDRPVHSLHTDMRTETTESLIRDLEYFVDDRPYDD